LNASDLRRDDKEALTLTSTAIDGSTEVVGPNIVNSVDTKMQPVKSGDSR